MSTRITQQNNIAETLIGAGVVAVALAFLAFAYYRTGSGSLSGYEINAKLPKADGLAVGTDVRLAGIKVGTVSDLTLDPKTYLVTVGALHLAGANSVIQLLCAKGWKVQRIQTGLTPPPAACGT